MTFPEKELHAKEFVNARRKECGLRALGKLKRGIPHHPGMCPIALGLQDCGVSRAYPLNIGVELCRRGEGGLLWRRLYPDPETVNFMRAFDRGEYPHLEIPKATTMKIKKPNQRKLTVVPL